MNSQWPYFLANQPQQPNADLAVTNKYTGEEFTRVALADPAAIDAAIEAATSAAEPLARMAPYQRQRVLDHCVRTIHGTI